MLTEMLNESESLKGLSLPERTILLRLASKLQSQTNYLFMTEDELQENTSLGSIDQWKQLLRLQETKNYIKSTMAAVSEIAQRKTFHALIQEAMAGNVQAAKQVQELSGIMNQQDSNRIVVLHQIPRPSKQLN
jgi:hypothetical protein